MAVPMVGVGGNSRGFAFVTFEDDRDAEDALDGMHGKRIDGRTINVKKVSKLSLPPSSKI